MAGIEANVSIRTNDSAPINNEKVRAKLEKKLLDSMKTMKDDEKIPFLMTRLIELEQKNLEIKREVEEQKRENGKTTMLEKKLNSMEKQLSKAEMAKSKLEELCRELNKANKNEKELNQQRLKSLQLTHGETVNGLKHTLSEIQESVAAKQEHTKRVAEVEKLSTHLNELAADYDGRLISLKKLYEEREADMNLVAKAKEEEVAILSTQVNDMKKRVLEVFEENVLVKQQLLGSEEKLHKSIESELAHRKTLDDYSTKYSKLLESLTKSNKSFDKVKGDMTRMNGNLIRVESEAKRYKAKVDESNEIISSMSLKIENLKKELLLKDRQLMQLQELCRRLRSADAEIRENDQMGENDDDSGTSSNKVVENKDKDGNVL